MVLHHGLHLGQSFFPCTSVGKQERELIDHGQNLVLTSKLVEQPYEPSDAADIWTHPELRLQHLCKASHLCGQEATVSHEDDSLLAVGEPPEQPRLAHATASDQCHRIPGRMLPPRLQSEQGHGCG